MKLKDMTPQEITGYTTEAKNAIEGGYISAISGTVELDRVKQYIAHATGSAFVDMYIKLTQDLQFADKTYSKEVIDAVILAATHDWIDGIASVVMSTKEDN